MPNPAQLEIEQQIKTQAVEDLISALALKMDRQNKAIQATRVHIELLRDTLKK